MHYDAWEVIVTVSFCLSISSYFNPFAIDIASTTNIPEVIAMNPTSKVNIVEKRNPP